MKLSQRHRGEKVCVSAYYRGGRRKKCASATFYETTPQEIIDTLKRAAGVKVPREPAQQTASA